MNVTVDLAKKHIEYNDYSIEVYKADVIKLIHCIEELEQRLNISIVSGSYLPKCNRVEVIDKSGRAYTNYDCKSVETQMQDKERTLKINLNNYKMKELQYVLKYTKDLIEQEPEKSSFWHYNKLVSKIEEVIDATYCCTELVCIDDGGLPNLTQDNVYKMIVESNRHYNIIDDNGNDVLISKKYLVKTR